MLFHDVQGVRVPALGFGTYRLTGEACVSSVAHALTLGYRHLDTAQSYDNEAEVGRGLAASGVRFTDFYAAAICHGVFDRFPGLRLASVENGASWIPDLLYRLGDAANRNPGFFKTHPTETFRSHVWVTPFWEDHVDELVDVIGSDRLLLGSDWPHAEGTKQPIDFVTDTLAALPADAVEQIAWTNAVDLLGLDIERAVGGTR